MAARSQRQGPAADAGDQWVEEQLQETRARLHKLENELEQALKHVWSVDTDVRTLTEAVSSSAAATVSVDKLREEIRQLSDGLTRIQDRQNQLGNRIDESVRRRESESGREREDIATLSKQLEAVQREVSKFDARIQSLEEAIRHTEDEISGVRLVGQSLERSIGEMSTKVERNEEAGNRLGEEIARMAGILERLEQEDAKAGERVALLNEQMNRLAHRVDKLSDLEEFPKEVRDLVQRAAYERDQISQRLNVVDRLSTEASDLAKALQQTVALVEQRSHNQLAQLTDLTSRLQDLEEQTAADLKKIIKVTLRQRRRQIEALNQEVKELTQGEPKNEG